MMRIRTIKPEFWKSPDIGALDIFSRLLFIGLWSLADDHGRGNADPMLVKSELFPYDPDHQGEFTEYSVSIQGGLKRLKNQGLIRLYKIEDRKYYEIITFAKHQKINRPSPTKYPPSTSANAQLLDSLTEDSLSLHAPFIEDSSPEQGTGNRELGNRDQVTGNRDQEKETPLAWGKEKTDPTQNETDAPTPTPPDTGGQTLTPQTDTGAQSAPKQNPQGRRLPKGWEPSPQTKNWTMSEIAGSGLDPGRELERFRDYWEARAGKDGRKLDWDKTWRNWIRKAVDQHKNHNGGRPYRLSQTEIVALNQAQAAVLDAETRRTGRPVDYFDIYGNQPKPSPAVSFPTIESQDRDQC